MLAVLTADQQGSRSGPDLVPATLGQLARLPLLRGFERTAGDEFQGVLDDPAALAAALEVLLRAGEWNIGVGFGAVDLPLPPSTRAGSGAAFVHAREAVTAAKSSPWHLRVVDGTGAGPARALETTLWLWAAVLARRTPRGWEVADLVDTQGLSYEEAGRRLGITQSAVSQRAQPAGIVEGRRARELVTYLAGQLIDPTGATP
ncbi:transposase [Nocardioides sp. cx-169]|uniref:sigma factor-like helix-turn-helix DNA-binding protein n=1 Tax=Nocardioides sp. cx-169 TaxID=2899080 RepID=UPI001E618710|nr:sigma factor-like helix-turn-helix DNA-binding protein [Nocardioides sp. cx-169]MCD4534641.1 transposase [Nocardioides sp. cx-169]